MKRLLLSLGLVLVVFQWRAGADDWDKRTTVTFSEPVEVSGKVLPAGTYVMELADSRSDRDLVRIFNADETRWVETAMAIPVYRATATRRTVIQFEERAAGDPPAMKDWYYPGDLRGEEFLYSSPGEGMVSASQIPKVKATTDAASARSLATTEVPLIGLAGLAVLGAAAWIRSRRHA